jgi:hypothetical protein
MFSEPLARDYMSLYVMCLMVISNVIYITLFVNVCLVCCV